MPDVLTAVLAAEQINADLADLTAAQLISLWDELGSWDRPDIIRLEAEAGPIVSGAASTAALNAAALASTVTGTATAPVDTAQIVEEAIARLSEPFHAGWHALSQGRPWTESIQVGRSTIEAVGRDTSYRSARRALAVSDPTLGDVWQPKPHQQHPTSYERKNWNRPAFKRYVRVLGPKSCEWCQFFSTLTYYSAESATFGHDRCNCLPAPINEDVEIDFEAINEERRAEHGYTAERERKVISELNAHSKKLRTAAKA